MNGSIRGLRVLPSCLGATPRASQTLNPFIHAVQWIRRSNHTSVENTVRAANPSGKTSASSARDDSRRASVLPGGAS